MDTTSVLYLLIVRITTRRRLDKEVQHSWVPIWSVSEIKDPFNYRAIKILNNVTFLSHFFKVCKSFFSERNFVLNKRNYITLNYL